MKQLTVIGSALATSIVLVGCGGGSSDITTSETGYFIDSPVENLTFTTEDGVTGKTDALGHFQFKYDQKVEFRIGNLILGEAIPTEDGLITPEILFPNDETHKTLLLQTLQALDLDHNLSNGITVAEGLLDDIDPVPFSELNETTLVSLNNGELGEYIDIDYNGNIDIDPEQARIHFGESINLWSNGYRPDDNESNYGYNGDMGTTINIMDMPTSILTQELQDAIAYMGNEERLAHDIYINLYDYHIQNNTNIYQLQNIATRSEQTHIGIVQSLVEKYNLGSDDLTNVTTGVADNTIAFENMPRGQYDIPAIQALYDTLYTFGQGSAQDALRVGCMVEVTDINDLDKYIVFAQEANATDVIEDFNVLRNGSYSHYWAFDKGLKNLGVNNGCYVEGDALLGENKEGIYPQNENGRE